jgi:hypothetical protein
MGLIERLAVISFAKDCVTHLAIHSEALPNPLSRAFQPAVNEVSIHRRLVVFEVMIKSN